jgi:MraZ protein
MSILLESPGVPPLALKKVYQGEESVQLDDKFRIVVPKENRLAMDENEHTIWFGTRGFNRRILLYPRATWEAILARHATLLMNPDREAFDSIFLAATELRRDTMGRITLPAHLRAWAHIKDAATVVGRGDRLEVWDPATRERFLAEADFETLGKSRFGSEAAHNEREFRA